MLEPKSELLANLTPESLKGLSQADKERILEIVKDLQLTGYQRYMRDLHVGLAALRADCAARRVDQSEELFGRLREQRTSLAEIIERARKNPNREPSLLTKLASEPDEVARQERLRQESEAALTAEVERARQARLSAQPEHVMAELSPLPVPSNLPQPISFAEVAREAQEQASKESRDYGSDFIDRICGPGSKKPSGRSDGGKFGFMG